jgi:hypothetical protein
VLGVLCGHFQGGFNFGSPEAFFEVSLLWTSAYDARRISGPADKTQRLFQLPSWSWAGWGGAVGMSMCLHTPRYLHSVGRNTSTGSKTTNASVGTTAQKAVEFREPCSNQQPILQMERLFRESISKSPRRVARRLTKLSWRETVHHDMGGHGKTPYSTALSHMFFQHGTHLDCTYRNTVPSVKDESREPLQMKSGSRSDFPAPKAVALTPSNWTTRFNRLWGNPW